MNNASKVPLVVSVGFIILFFLPIAFLLFGGSSIGHFRFLPDIVFSSQTLSAFVYTFEFAIPASIIIVAEAFVYAWAVFRTDIPGKKVLILIPIVGLTLPLFVQAFAWDSLLDPRVGLINVITRRLIGQPIFDIHSLWGLIFAFSLGGVPLAFLMVSPAVESMDASLEEASKVAGASMVRTFLTVTIPLLIPAFLGTLAIFFLGAITNFDYPYILIISGNTHTLATYVDFWVSAILPPNYQAAESISVIYLVTAGIFFAFYAYFTRRLFRFTTLTGRGVTQTVNRLGRRRALALLYCLLIFGFTSVIPLLGLAWMSFTPFAGSLNLVLNFTNYEKAINQPFFWQSLTTSVYMALIVVLVGVPLTTILAYGALRSGSKAARFIEFTTLLPEALPGIVIGLGLFLLFLNAPILNRLYGTIWPVVVATLMVPIPVAFRVIAGNIIQIGPELEEASRVCGGGGLTTVRKVTLPLLRSALFNSVIINFLDPIKALGPIILLTTSQTVLYASFITDLYITSPSGITVVSAASIMLTLLLSGVILGVRLVEWFSGGRRSKMSRKSRESSSSSSLTISSERQAAERN